MAQFVSEYGKTTEPAQPDGRLDAPAFHRNHEPIWSAVGGFLATQSGDLLEIGSGTGQHAAAFAPRAPGMTWWPSDIYELSPEEHRRMAHIFGRRKPALTPAHRSQRS